MSEKYLFHVEKMSCQSCVMTIAEELGVHPAVVNVQSDLATRTVTVTGTFSGFTPEQIVSELSSFLSSHRLVLEPQKKSAAWRELLLALPLVTVFVVLFVVLQKLGIVNLVGGETVGLGTAFLVGVVASLSTCMAVVGGVLLSLSATYAREESPKLYLRDQLSFHLARLIAFFILGGVVGVLGSFFQLGVIGNVVLGLGVGLVMLILGINLLDLFHRTKKWQITLPGVVAVKVKRWATTGHLLTPILVGIATFFLPCGFTQSMQVYSLSTGSFTTGALTMLFFALGTLPVLSLISFGFLGVQRSQNAGVFFKTAGLIVILFALFNIINSLVAAGLIAPIFRL